MILTPKNCVPCRLFSAYGVEIKNGFLANTKTGEVHEYVTDLNGNYLVDHKMESALAFRAKYQPPLRVEPKT